MKQNWPTLEGNYPCQALTGGQHLCKLPVLFAHVFGRQVSGGPMSGLGLRENRDWLSLKQIPKMFTLTCKHMSSGSVFWVLDQSCG